MTFKQKVLGIFLSLVFVFCGFNAQAQTYDLSSLTRAQLIQIITNLITQLQGNYQFTADLTLGSQGNDVLQLQIILNEDGDTQVAISGNGAPGNETTYFGNLTKVALLKYQAKHSLTQTGILDAETRNYLNKRGLTLSFTETVEEQTQTQTTEETVDLGFEPIDMDDISSNQTLSGVVSASNSFIYGDEGLIQTAVYNVEAINDKFILKELKINIENASVISKVYLTVGNKVLQTKPGATTITFSDINFEIPINQKQAFNIVIELSEVGTGKGQTGSNIKTTFVEGKAISNATGEIKTVTLAAGSINAIDVYIYESVPEITLLPMPNVDFAPGTMVGSTFKISASDTGDLTWKRLVWDVSKTQSLAINNPVLYKNNNQIVGTFELSTGLRDVDGAATTGTISFLADSEQLVPAGGEDVYELKFDISGSIYQGYYVNTSIQSNSSYEAPTDFGDVSTSASFVWSDTSAQGHSYDTDDWMNDYLVKNLPTDDQTLSY
jgi:peptidoglycan hydrolase-like protein with peptidoglycan-binding domain